MTVAEIEAESPFLPDGRQFAWNHSSLAPAKLCPRKYLYSVIEGWRPKAANDDITFGSAYARALEMYHRWRADGLGHEESLGNILVATLADTWDWQSQHNAKTRETLVRSIIWYLDHFEDDPCETHILANGAPAVELSFRFQLDEDILLCGHMDRIVTYAGDYYVQDQKTTGATLSGYYFKRYSPDDQMSLYSIAAEVIWHQPVRGVMIDAAQIAVGFTRFERGFAFRTKAQNEAWLADAKYWIHRTWEAAEQGYPMNDAACMMYGGCPFREICSKDPSVRQNYLETMFERKPRNPLGVH
jgi:hypothetical protein